MTSRGFHVFCGCESCLQAWLSQATPKWLWSTAHAIPKETTNEGSGYFSIIEGQNGQLYIGTAKYGVNAYLVEFDPNKQADEASPSIA